MPRNHYESEAGFQRLNEQQYNADSHYRSAISEPADHYSTYQPVMESRRSERNEESGAIYAKEPERPSTTRRASQSSRGRGRMEEGYEDEPRSQGGQQRGTSRRTVQARRGTDRTPARRGAAAETKTGRQKKSRRGFAAMSAEQQREIARKGGLTVSRNRRHMADIGRIGGEHSHGGRRTRAKR